MLTGCGDDASDKKPKQKIEQKQDDKKSADKKDAASVSKAAGINANVTPVKEKEFANGNTNRPTKAYFTIELTNGQPSMRNGEFTFEAFLVNTGKETGTTESIEVKSLRVLTYGDREVWHNTKNHNMQMSYTLKPGERRSIKFIIRENSIPNYNGQMKYSWTYNLRFH